MILGRLMAVEELYERGFALRCDGRYDEAKDVFSQVLAASPGHADSKWQLGLIQCFVGEFDESLVTLQEVVNANPAHIKARYDLAQTQMMLGMMDEACANFREVLNQDPTHEEANRQIIYCP